MADLGGDIYCKESLLLKFNERERFSFADVYIEIFDELNHFADRLFYATGVGSEDLIQDIFLNIWSNNSLKFLSIDHIKNYIYLSIKNKHKDFLKHKKISENYMQYIENIDDYQFGVMVETETISLLTLIDDILPAECAKVLRMFMDGYDVKEISEELGKSQFTIYNQRREAVMILKKYASSKKITFLLNLLNII